MHPTGTCHSVAFVPPACGGHEFKHPRINHTQRYKKYSDVANQMHARYTRRSVFAVDRKKHADVIEQPLMFWNRDNIRSKVEGI